MAHQVPETLRCVVVPKAAVKSAVDQDENSVGK